MIPVEATVQHTLSNRNALFSDNDRFLYKILEDQTFTGEL